MTAPAVVRTDVLAALQAIDGATWFDGYVPDTVPQDANGFVRPYGALYVGPPVGDQGSTTVCGSVDVDGFTRRFQTTLVAANPAHLDTMADLVRTALTNLRIGPGRVTPDFEQQASVVPLIDTATSPARYFLPLQWAVTTQ